MSRSKRDILDTEAMLHRVAAALYDNGGTDAATCRADAESLRRASMTLQRWFELECNGNIQREGETGEGRPRWCSSQDGKMRWVIPDREAGARKRIAKILRRYPGLTAYIQTDPRGCALYILRPGDVPEGQDVSAYYSRGVAVYR